MRIEILFFAITAAIAYNIYTEGKFLQKMMSYKKYYQIGGIIFAALSVYWLIKRNPENAKNIIMTSNDYIKYLPLDSNTTSIITPILDMTTRSFGRDLDVPNPIIDMNQYVTHGGAAAAAGNTMRRSVSETKKKFIAYNQNWKCNHCSRTLNHTFEIDHRIRLEYGGSNEVSNLEALCRDCHGKKTAAENMGI